MTAAASSAKLVQDLVDYDGPQLILLKTNRSRHMLAIAIQRDDMEEPFFSCEVIDGTFSRYFDQRADLHYVFSRALGKNYYFFDLATAKDDVVKLTKASAIEAQDSDYWPQVGFF